MTEGREAGEQQGRTNQLSIVWMEYVDALEDSIEDYGDDSNINFILMHPLW